MESGQKRFLVCEDCQEITELKSMGITIYRYKINLGNVQGDQKTGDLQVSTGSTKDIFIVMNSSNIPDLSFLPDDGSKLFLVVEQDRRINFVKDECHDYSPAPSARTLLNSVLETAPECDLFTTNIGCLMTESKSVIEMNARASNKLKCNRCQYIARRAHKYLECHRLIDQEDIAGICDHCRSKQQTRDVRSLCDQIITKYFMGKFHQEQDKTFTQIPSDSYWDRDLKQILHKRLQEAPTDADKIFKGAHDTTFGTRVIPFDKREADETKKRLATTKIGSDESFIAPFPKLPKPDSEYPKNTFLFPKKTKNDQEELSLDVSSQDLIVGLKYRDSLRTAEMRRGESAEIEWEDAQKGLPFSRYRGSVDFQLQKERQTVGFKGVKGKPGERQVTDERREKYKQATHEREEDEPTYKQRKRDRGIEDESWDDIDRRRVKSKESVTEKGRKIQERGIKSKSSERMDRKSERPEGKGSEKGERVQERGIKSKSSETYVQSKPGRETKTKSTEATSKPSVRPKEKLTEKGEKIQDRETKSKSSETYKVKKPDRRTQSKSKLDKLDKGTEIDDLPTGREKQKKTVKEVPKKLPPPPIPPILPKIGKEVEKSKAQEDKEQESTKLARKGKDVQTLNIKDKKHAKAEKKETTKTDDLITKGMKDRMKAKAKETELPEKKPLRPEDYIPKEAKKAAKGPKLKARRGEKISRKVEVKVVEKKTSKVVPHKSLLQSHLTGMERASKAGKRGQAALSKSALELKMNQVVMESYMDTLRYALPQSKAQSRPGELPPIPPKYTLFQIETDKIADQPGDIPENIRRLACKYDEQVLKKFMIDYNRAKKFGKAHDSDLEIEIESYLKKLKPKKKEKPKMIKNTKIINYDSDEYFHEAPKEKPLIFESNITRFPSIDLFDQPPTPEEVSIKKPIISMDDEGRNIMRYTLSDRSFIDKGWTLLPTEKVLRKMNIYRMRPSHPEFDWFKHNRSKGYMQYNTGEKLAEFEDDGGGRCYYRNGRLALNYYNAEDKMTMWYVLLIEANAKQRYVIYSNGEPDKTGRPRPVTVLAMFDYAGNGIVFDHNGKTRLKYNQTEGIVLDPALDSTHWKWHSLNDPPVLQKVIIDTQMAFKDPQIVQLGKSEEDHKPQRPNDEQMLAIELENFVREKSRKLTAEFHPYQIKMKALQINDEFSLKILDQSTIYLLFQDGPTHLKLNLGMVLDNHEIVDTETVELGLVHNSLERFPARTDSLEEIQKNLGHAQKREHMRLEKENRLHPSVLRTVESADQMEAGLSRPLRTIGNVHACSPCNVKRF